MIRAVAAALAATCLLAACWGAASADDGAPGDKLPEPALRFAKDASLRVTEMEREWLKLAEGLLKARSDFAVTDGSASPPRDQASRLLAGARKLLDDQKRLGGDLGRFKDALGKAGSCYRDVAVLYTAQAAQARAGEIRDDYLQLAKVYETKARSSEERAKNLSIPADAKARAEVIEEGNLFLERFIEALSVGPVGETDRSLLAGRLKKHGERCQALAEALSGTVESLLEGADAPEVREKLAGRRKEEAAAIQRPGSPASAGRAKSSPKRDLSALAGVSWTAAVTIQGVPCVQVVRFSTDGTCVQTLYRQGPNGKGRLIGTLRVACEWDTEGVLDVYLAGMIVERGQITLRGKDEWTYEILANAGNRELAGTKLTFTRDGRP